MFDLTQFEDINPRIVQQFLDFHRDNPRVFELFKRFTNEARRAGRAHYGIKSIAERIRWHVSIETKGDDFKINNNFSSCYARMLIADDPSLKEFFETRRSPTAELDRRGEEYL